MHRFTSHRPGEHRWFLHADLPDNPLCWLFGHKAVVEVEVPGYNIDPWVRIECRRDGRRYQPPAELDLIRSTDPQSQRERAKERAAARVEFALRDPDQMAASASGRDGYLRSRLELSLEHSRQKWSRFAAGVHVGNRYSESPWHAHVYVPGHAVHVSAGGVLSRFADWLGRGHKRDLEVRLGEHQLSWKVWYDDDGGSDQYHDCERDRPMPWDRFLPQRRRYRTWACLRDGRIDTNPVDVLWGTPSYHYEDADAPRDVVVYVGQFPHDHYPVTFTLQRQTRHRDHGPAWARRESVSWSASWRTPGIPIRNHEWKGDDVLASSESVTVEQVEDGTWLAAAMSSLVERIKKDRIHHGYVHREAAESS